MIPEPQFLNVLCFQIRTALLIVLLLLRQTVLKTVKLYGQPGGGAVKIQNKNPDWMLATKFESCEAMTP